MTGSQNYRAFLQQIYPNATGQGQTHYPLSSNQSIIIGREAGCQILLDSKHYKGVSRRHIEIRPLVSQSTSGMPLWQVCDLGSANGTYVNGQRLQGCQTLQIGDRIKLGLHGPEFIFECHVNAPVPHARPLAIQQSDSALHLSQIFPIVSTKQDLLKKAYLIPGVITILLVVGLFSSIGQPQTFNALLAIYLTVAGYYFIYKLSGKPKPWWLLAGSALSTILILLSPILSLFIFVFREILPGEISRGENVDFFTVLLRMFFGAGLMEELLKALPVFALLWLGTQLKSPWRERIGVWEPLDGILLGTASAAGFTLLETLGQYVPGIVHNVAAQAGEGAGELFGIQLLIPRIIASVAGHMAYSGYFGYFIGLSVLKPAKRWKLLGIGYLTASGLHALWNASDAIGKLVTAVAGVLAYAFLMAAILKARQLSPTRSQNQATRFHTQNYP
ncbi:PrsW family intramembrane metalloprotease [Scytonema sp. UIC 10036]|uniref:PrsW family glutamic-type intramembrane protease n=1 Tax=Scytonema sp. UIC 10036 TaxID=2304196 RepID=UPI0012DACB15|nr:PrsW family glutamic-type intramembrane protease [Scytonema sp. UIC 10036]MUG96835.1 PrsW family intramembrane metalloprotease [Scytonema sp. UIC 10036]